VAWAARGLAAAIAAAAAHLGCDATGGDRLHAPRKRMTLAIRGLWSCTSTPMKSIAGTRKTRPPKSPRTPL
jgi:hypothetical protein